MHVLPFNRVASQFGSQILVKLKSDWVTGSKSHPPGSLLAIDLDQFLRQGKDNTTVTVLFSPTDRMSMNGYSRTRNYLVIEILEYVKSRLQIWEFSESKGWIIKFVESEAAVRGISVSAIDSTTSDECWVTTSSFTTPSTLSMLNLQNINNAECTNVETLCISTKSLPAKFDATGIVEFQEEAISADGTKVPYFVIMSGSLKRNGDNPTLLYGYGGFQVSILPNYAAVLGCSWLAHGNILVHANIRGGGELGPKWHQAALKENRIKAYEDFIAVAEDLVRKKFTSPKRLGIRGGSNGGLLMGNMQIMRPDLFGAIVNAVPLLDMKRYSKLLAGASWMAEYGNPDTDDWLYLQQYSPYHNVQLNVKYPPLLVTTSTKDDRVHPVN